MDQPKPASKEANNLDLKQIRQIVTLMAENDLSYFHFEQDGAKIELRRGSDFKACTDLLKSLPLSSSPQIAMAPMQSAPTAAAAPVPIPVPGGSPSTPTEEPSGPTINSPMVGTFYRSPGPNEPSFANVGDVVDENTTVCIIEAMKVMNEIKAEARGTITRLLAEDGKPVQYGQPLFELKA
jgi:acetyl-CoA carboxylase biotin carboxyl carrier protein